MDEEDFFICSSAVRDPYIAQNFISGWVLHDLVEVNETGCPCQSAMAKLMLLFDVILLCEFQRMSASVLLPLILETNC